MKSIFVIAFSLFFFSASAQECGTWIRKDTTDPWSKVKTFSGIPDADSIYTESEWTLTSGSKRSYRNSSCPCECYDSYIEIQYRVNPKTGIQERRTRTVYFDYVPKEKTQYQKIIDSLSNP